MKTFEVVCIKLLILLSVLFKNSIAHHKEISVEEALKKNLISATFQSLTGHTGNCIETTISNHLNSEVYLFFEPGRIIDSKNDKLQNIILTKKVVLKIPAKAIKVAQLFGFCCQLKNSSPKNKSIYELGGMADSGLVKLAQFLNANNFDITTQQHAVWCLSDNNSLESIPQTFDSCSNELIALCSKIKNLPLPNNCFTYLYVPNRMFSDIKYFYKTKISYPKKSDSKLMIAVFDSTGNTIKVIVDNNYSNIKNNNFLVSFSVYNWKKGKYYLRILEGGKKEFEKVFEI
jgi:hypothetical protein